MISSQNNNRDLSLGLMLHANIIPLSCKTTFYCISRSYMFDTFVEIITHTNRILHHIVSVVVISYATVTSRLNYSTALYMGEGKIKFFICQTLPHGVLAAM